MKIIRSLFPTMERYRKWSLPSKCSFWGLWLGVPLGIVFYLFPRSGEVMISDSQIDKLASIIAQKTTLEGSPYCCDIKTAQVLLFLPAEGKITLPADSFIAIIPKEIKAKDYKFRYSTDPMDSMKIFDCKDVGHSDFNIFFFENQKAICSKQARLILKDPDDFCNDGIEAADKVF